MKYNVVKLTSFSCLLAFSAVAREAVPTDLMEAKLRSSVEQRSEQALLDELTAKVQAELTADHASGYAFELRPRVSENSAGAALRVYLPEQWSRQALSEQLALAAQSEQLRVAALEWQDLMTAYRSFCDYRLLDKKQGMLRAELQFIEPYLAQADTAVEHHQLAIVERARLYSHYLDLLNQLDEVFLERIEVKQMLQLVLGSHADLDGFSTVARLPGLGTLNADALVQKALVQRSDYRRYDIEAQALTSAEAAAESQRRFRLKYIQPSYELDYLGGDHSWSLSASFILPWGMQDAAVPVYRRQRAWLSAAQQQQQRMISDKIRVLVKAATAYDQHFKQRLKGTGALVEQLRNDLDKLKGGMLSQVRDQLVIRERLLQTEWLAAEAEYKKECLAVDLAEALGRLK